MAQLRINLLPPRVRQARARRALIAIGATVSVAVLALPIGVLYLKWSSVASLRQQIRRVDEESKAFAGIIERIKAIDAQEGELVKRLDVIDKLTARQSIWIRFLEAVNAAQSAARDLWLTSIATKALGGADAGKVEVTITGMAFSIASMDVFTKALGQGEVPAELMRISWTPAKVGGDRSQQFTAVVRIKV